MEGLNRLIFYLTLFCYTQFTDAADTLTPIDSLNDGDGKTLISSGKVFEIGFFSPGSSNNRYLGIWYKSSPLTVAWVANRNNPLTDRSGSLRIRDNILVITNKNGTIFWSSNSTAADQSSVAQILDSGNFVLRNASGSDSGNYFWQSFDHPTDTLLPGMKLGWDMKTGLNRILTSWKSSDDPSNGDYSCGVEVRGLPQIVIRRREAEVFRTGESNADQFSSRNPVTENTIQKATFVYNSEEVYFTFELVDPAIFMRLQMDENGYLDGYLWDGRLEWEILFSLQKDLCDIYNLCGPNGLCYIDLAHNCECLTGFIPKSPKDWDVFNKNDGCVRISPLDCRNGEGFIKYNNVKWPDVVSFRENLSITDTDCRSYCLKNCSCTAYAYLASNSSEHGCLFWYGDLFDVRISLSNYGQDLYVRLSAATMKSMATSRKRRRLLKVKLSLSAPFILLLISIMTWCIIQKKRRKANGKGDQSFCKKKSDAIDGDEECRELPAFDLATVVAATNNFSLENKIGGGGFGPVYKGIFPTGQEIAVKRLSQSSGQGLKELKNEVILISKLQHRNLVRLLGYCIQGEEMMLVYEYLANRSLDAYIFDKTRSKHLGWNVRFEIVLGIARGLLYLHQDSRLRIIHRDLKASNILLDEGMKPKISDFGLARTFGGDDQTEGRTRTVVGTYGYMSPEYAVDGRFSFKSDVFSFGVLLLEIVSGEKNNGFCHPDHDFNLLGHAWKLWRERRAFELLDASMGDEYSRAEALRSIHVGLLCVQRCPEDRPGMSSMLMLLQGETAVLIEPKQPGFYTERNPNESDPSIEGKVSGPSNEITFSLSEGR
ncbi:hypothetical protein Nepgr_026161 [Nepenthes gracilis]|uniref:Receptor-like serine/threonine-protein kinase n=1 Tax=Nepenthes gracilis TaxID=150966 RepID=A0AAD3T6C3_NEPGR|nr:hypothetical protein Nepgr_026161 [Nepenthes gracilis]